MASMIASGGARLAAIFLVFGALTGAVAGASTFYPIGEIPSIVIGGYCFGVEPIIGSTCGGIDGTVYVFPGLAFGIVFGPLLYFCRRVSAAGAVAYALAAFVANAVAVSVCIFLIHPLDDLLSLDNLILDIAISGVVAGAVGGGLLGAVLAVFNPASTRALSIAVAAGLGVLTPVVIMLDQPGIFAFLIVWQAGYAAAVAASLPRAAPP